MSVSCECGALSGRGVCVGLITHPEDSYWVWCMLSECDHEALATWRPWSTRGCQATWGGVWRMKRNKNLLCEHGTNRWIAQRLGI